MNIMRPLTVVYRDAPFHIKLKAPLLRAILIVLTSLTILLVITQLIKNDSFARTIIYTASALFMIAALVGVQSGHFTQVSNIFFTILELTLFLLQVSRPYSGPISISNYSLILGSFLVFGAVFISSRKVIFVLCILYLTSFFGYLALVVYPGAELIGLPINLKIDIIFPLIATISIPLGLISFRIIFDRVVNRTLETLTRTKEREAWARKLAISSSKQMAKTKDLLEDANETAQSANEIEESLKAIDERFKTLYQRMDKAQESLNSVKSSALTMTSLAQDQSAQVDQSGSSIEQMVASINNVASVISNRSQGVRSLSHKATSGAEVMDEAWGAFEKVRTQVNSIKDLATMISDIAERTNLLAMNASIQAAHAGESGKGFAVVAGEVRTLSESTSKSAASIGNSIGDLVKAIDIAGGAINTTSSAFTEISQEIEFFAGAIDEIGQNVSELDKGSQELLTSTSYLRQTTTRVDEQSQHVSSAQLTINEAMEGIASLTAEMIEETGEITQETTRISSSTKEIQSLAHELENQSRALNEEIEK